MTTRRPAQRRTRPARSGARSPAGTQPPAEPKVRFTSRAAILVLVLTLLMISYTSSMRVYLDQRGEMAAAQAEIAEAKAHIKAARAEKRRWDDPAFIKAQARERFGWVMPGETLYQVIAPDGEALGSAGSLTDPATIAPAELEPWWQEVARSFMLVDHPEVVEEPQPAKKIKPQKKIRND